MLIYAASPGNSCFEDLIPWLGTSLHSPEISLKFIFYFKHLYEFCILIQILYVILI